MRKKTSLALLALPALLTSCIVGTHHFTTGNPIGTKEGIAKCKTPWDAEAGIAAAAKKGGITKIGSADMTYFLSGRTVVRVTGE